MGVSLGSAEGLDRGHLKRFRALIDRVELRRLLIGVALFVLYGKVAAPDRTGTRIVVSQAAVDGLLGRRLGVAKQLLPVKNTRGGISKKSMMLNDATPNIEVDPETYEVRADGELLVCEPARELPLAQRYFLF